MSLSQSITKLLRNHQSTISTLTKEENESLDDVKASVGIGLSKYVLSSIKEFVEENPKIMDEVKEGTIGSFLLGCLLGKEGSVCSPHQKEDFVEEKGDENIFVIDDEEITAIYLNRGNTTANIYLSDGKKELTNNEKQELLSAGISTVKIFLQNDENFYFSHSLSLATNEEKDKSLYFDLMNFFESNTILLVVIVALFVMGYLLFDNFKYQK